MGKDELSVPFSLCQLDDLFICYMSRLVYQLYVQRAADQAESLLFGKGDISLEPDCVTDIITRIVKMQIRFFPRKVVGECLCLVHVLLEYNLGGRHFSPCCC